MIDDELKTQLKRWGYATVTRFAANDDGPSMGDSVLVSVREMAPGTKERAERDLVSRDGDSRLRHMARAAGVQGMAKVPAWACDPIRARNDADRPHTRHAIVDNGIPDDLRWIESAISAMQRQFPIRAAVLREEFTGTGTQRMKAGRVAVLYGGKISKWVYCRELAKALEWLRMRNAA